MSRMTSFQEVSIRVHATVGRILFQTRPQLNGLQNECLFLLVVIRSIHQSLPYTQKTVFFSATEQQLLDSETRSLYEHKVIVQYGQLLSGV